MKNWYLTREGINGTHRGTKLRGNKKVLLSDEQVKLHNKHKEFLVQAEAPKTIDECANPSDFEQAEVKKAEVVEPSQEKKEKGKRD